MHWVSTAAGKAAGRSATSCCSLRVCACPPPSCSKWNRCKPQSASATAQTSHTLPYAFLPTAVRNATFMVTDSCRDCKESDLLVSAAGLTVLTGVDVGISPKLRIAWAPTSCALLIEGAWIGCRSGCVREDGDS